ncbi:hypothetical protein [Pseudorhodoferax sp.]|uniref:hypothetical protein n=1 Tax=Pseudorhodoferax sp. TaxID=1993553 RepID=UPI0039E635DF
MIGWFCLSHHRERSRTAMPAASHRLLLVCALTSTTLWLAACSTTPKPAATPVPLVSSVAPLEQFMSDAARSGQEGDRSGERDTYRKAAQAYPTSKEPWLKLAQGYFDAADYGNAILAAQEALQRDADDKVANSLLAVSGLRVSASALASMRKRQDLSGDTRRQAEDIVKSLRESLGETVLVPAAPAADAAPTARRPNAPARPRPAAAPRPKPAAAAQPTAAPAPAAKPANPFDTLK